MKASKLVPNGWRRTRLRFVVRLNPSKSEITLPDDEEVSFLPMDAIGEDGSIRLDATRPVSAVQSGYSYFRNGDVTIAKITPCFENGKGALMEGLTGGIGFGTTELIVARPDKNRIDPRFLARLFQSREFRALGEGSMYGAGGQKRVPDDFVRDFHLALPSLTEQSAIATFLDRETGKIDALVEEQKRLIGLLKEKRQAVISHAVTKGLDPNARMKPSGVEWLGDVPEHWEVSRLQQVCSFEPGKAHEPFFDDDGQYICVTARFISTGGVRQRYCTQCITPARRDDILMVMSDLPNGRALARAFIVDDDGPYAVNQRVCSVTPRDGSPLYFFYQLDRNPGLLRNDDGANQTHLSNADFLKMPILVPPADEQDKIAVWLREQTKRFAQLASSAEQAIVLLQERRAALISAAITGKIDVGNITANEEVE